MENQKFQNTFQQPKTNIFIPFHKQLQPKITCTKKDQNSSSNRSKLSTASFIKWLRSRFQSSLPKRFPYLYFPHQLTRETSIQEIFVEFDSDGSGGLSRDEVFEMFRGFGINITMQHLNQLYDSVEVNLQELNCEMFKKCALGQKSNKVFREIVRQLYQQSENFSEQQKRYIPHNFTSMIIYLVYLSKRQQLRFQIQQGRVSIKEKVQNIENLLKLKDLSLNNQRLTLYTENKKKDLKNKFRDIWQKLNQMHGGKFSLSPKLQKDFYMFCLEKQSETNNKTQKVVNTNASKENMILGTTRKL